MTLVLAHRGASVQAPENTLAAFRLAVEQGADGIELDVHRTADMQLAVIHDETLDRTTDGTGNVGDLSMDEIRQFDAGARFVAEDDSSEWAGRGLRVPTLPEVLAWLPEGISLVVELKARAAAGVTAEALRESAVGRAGRAMVISFDEASIEEVHALDPDLPTGLLLVPRDRFERGLVWATEHGHAAVLPWEADLGLDPSGPLAQAAAYGRQVGCYVVNEVQRMQHLGAFRLWGFITDRPDLGRTALGPRRTDG
ncbi:MAG: glycerophosphodiester phosphodiesterase [Candidatus Limnocylindria bacterium]